jgi:hypothetical protein
VGRTGDCPGEGECTLNLSTYFGLNLLSQSSSKYALACKKGRAVVDSPERLSHFVLRLTDGMLQCEYRKVRTSDQ